VPLELALDVDPADGADVARLRAGGWRLADPRAAAGDVDAYRRYLQGSRGELSVAKEMYVKSAGGWFSDRSAAYLASGRPVVAQDTGVPELPGDEGFLTYDTPDAAAAALESVLAAPTRHARAARAIAEGHLDARRVLPRLLQDAGVG